MQIRECQTGAEMTHTNHFGPCLEWPVSAEAVLIALNLFTH